MKNNKRNGISLIVLVITIIVIIILSGAVILSLANNNPISAATKAVFASDVRNFQTELDLYKTNQFVTRMGSYNPNLLQADEISVTYDNNVDTSITMDDLIPSLGKSPKYTGQFKIVNGELIFQGSDTNKQDWSNELGVVVIIEGEPKINIMPPSESLVKQGTDIIYTVKFTSNAPLTTIDLLDNVEIVDNNGIALPIQPVINLGTLSGTSLDSIRQIDITIKTDNLLNGSYDLRIKSRTVINAENISNTQDTTSLIGFDVEDTFPPENPTMLASITIWTNGSVSVSITYSEDSAEKEYSFDAITWNLYTVPVIVTENNVTVYARGLDLATNESGVATLTVANIDKTAPTITVTNGGVTTSSVKVNAIASDTGGSSLNTSSYQYSKDNGTTWTSATNLTSYTFDSLSAGIYECKVKVADIAGNIAISDVVAISTEELGMIMMSAFPTYWTNENVTISINYPTEIVTKEYSTNGTTWSTYTVAVVVTSNSTVYARGFDAGNNQTTQATLTVTNIDKTAPTVTASNGGVTTSSVTINAVASDTGGSGLNVSSYQYSKDNGTTWTATTNLTNYTFTGLTTGTYNCRVRVLDNAGNTSTSNAVALTTTAMAAVSMSASPTGWTNGNVTVTITYPTEVVTKQYSLNGTTWNTYTLPIVVTTNNTTIYARGLDDGNNQTSQASLTVTNIDKTAPTAVATYRTADGVLYPSDLWTNQSVVITATATDTGSGVARYEITYNGSQFYDLPNATVTISGSTRTGVWVRAIDNVGNVGGLTPAHLVAIDKVAPTYSSYAITNVTSTGYDVYVYGVTDSLSGVNKLQFPTWTDLNGQDDIQANWQTNPVASGQNMGGGTWLYRVNTSAHNNEGGQYQTHIYLYDNVGNASAIVTTGANISKINYGTTIQDTYSNLYVSNNPTTALTTKYHDYDNYYNGNFYLTNSVMSLMLWMGGEDIVNGRILYDGWKGAYVYAGENTISLTRNSNLNRWMYMYIFAGGSTVNTYIGNLRFKFVDGSILTPSQAVTNGYIEPLVVMAGGSHASPTYELWTNFLGLRTGGSTPAKNYPVGTVIFKVKSKSALNSILLYSSGAFNTTYDGIRVFETVAGTELSTVPF